MCKKKMISLSAAVAVLSTAALAFDTNTQQTVTRFGGGAPGKYVYRDTNNLKTRDINGNVSISPIIKEGPGELGDALIYPAFYGGPTDKNRDTVSNWSSEFSVINTSDRAVIAKVVLYGKIASEELRDFNIYLSAHDVFRAKLENGRLISTDSSTVAKGLPSVINPKFNKGDTDLLEMDSKFNYRWEYDAIMASKDNPLDMFIDPDEEIDEDTGKTVGEGHGIYGKSDVDFEHDGYIVVYAMAQAADETYHSSEGLHKDLLIDYRHLVDTCRSSVADGVLNEWQIGIQDGIYSRNKLYLPNVSTNAEGKPDEIIPKFFDKDGNYDKDVTDFVSSNICRKVFNPSYYDHNVTFKSPEPVLTGSILISSDGSDGRGTRDMLLKAYAIDNFTDDTKNQILLWTEGEFAHLADRCLTHDRNRHGEDKSIVHKYDGNTSVYDQTCVERDAAQFALDNTHYEYTATDPDVSRLVVTQPYKRVLVQFKAKTEREIKKGAEPTYSAYAWNEDTGFDVADRRRYGVFGLGMSIYDDDEHSFTPTFGNFVVSPADAGMSSGIPYEVSNISLFATMSDDDKAKFESDFSKGYAKIVYKRNGANYLSGIVTQMSAVVHSDKQAEINWIYPYTEYAENVKYPVDPNYTILEPE